MKIKFIYYAIVVLYNSNIFAQSLSYVSIKDSIYADSIFRSFNKMDLDKYVGKSVKELLTDLEFKGYVIGYHEEPSFRLSHITIGYNSNVYPALLVYFDCLEYVPRRRPSIAYSRKQLDDENIVHEKIYEIYLVDYKRKPYPRYIKKTKLPSIKKK